MTAPNRQCGECVACCTILGVPSISKPAGARCPAVCATGCGNYESRPKECRDFSCLWLQDDGKAFRLMERPDKLGIILSANDPNSDLSKAIGQAIIAYESKDGALRTDAARLMIEKLVRRGLRSDRGWEQTPAGRAAAHAREDQPLHAHHCERETMMEQPTTPVHRVGPTLQRTDGTVEQVYEDQAGVRWVCAGDGAMVTWERVPIADDVEPGDAVTPINGVFCGVRFVVVDIGPGEISRKSVRVRRQPPSPGQAPAEWVPIRDLAPFFAAGACVTCGDKAHARCTPPVYLPELG